MNRRNECLRELGFELGYLSLLTVEGVKPLSRWEKGFDSRTEASLRGLGLKTTVVERSVQTGRKVQELLFSKSRKCLGLYERRFAQTHVQHAAESVRFEGLLFGYPACCVESYAARGYAKNALRRQDQSILFHWACPGCPVTPLLVPRYRTLYRQCRKVIGAAGLSGPRLAGPRLAGRRFGRVASMAAVLAAMITAPAVGLADEHRLPLSAWEDEDADLLRTEEETILGMNPAKADENGNQVVDGVDLALSFSLVLEGLPTEPSETQVYVTHAMAWGLETCQVCGEAVNMGLMLVTNPLEDYSLEIPYVAKHFLEHGSFAYSGSIHSGRVNPPLLRLILTSQGLGHFLPEPAGADADNDGLQDWEERAFILDPNRRDSDGDQIIDGVEVARDFHAQLQALPRVMRPEDGPKDKPFVVEHPMDGVETCPRCGDRVVMDVWDVIHPVTKMSVSIPSMALHYLAHGAFRWEGGRLAGGQGRVSPTQLQAVLRGQGDVHWLPVSPDQDGDLLTDQEEQGLRTESHNADEDGNGVLDGADLARSLAVEIAALPDTPSLQQVYRRDFQLKGLEHCAVCGETVNMGHLVVVNPLAGLYAKLPYIGLHSMEHGSFTYAGDVHGLDRAEVNLLRDAVRSSGPSHLFKAQSDSDGDGLKDQEEAQFRCDKGVADTDGDGVPDGFRLARQMWRAVNSLSRTPNSACYAVDHLLRGLVTCEVCGRQVNMGWVELINSSANLKLDLSYLNLHFMEHGSLAVSATTRVDPLQLEALLRGKVSVSVQANHATLRWLGETGLTYQVLSASEVTGPWSPGPTFQGDGKEIEYTDTDSATARKFYRVTAW